MRSDPYAACRHRAYFELDWDSQPEASGVMTVSYSLPAGVTPIPLDQHLQLLTHPAGGRVVVDTTVLAVWQAAQGKKLDDILAQHAVLAGAGHPEYVRAGLACLAEAGFLRRELAEPETPPQLTPEFGPLVSVIVVSYNSLAWLTGCFESLRRQSYRSLEFVVVDNGSTDASAAWAAEQHDVHLVRREASVGLAQAINQGVAASHGEYFLILNPDVSLETGAVAAMVAAAVNEPHPAAVAARLRLMWAPAFLNGMGNYVSPVGWGADSGLGHLDLGQFDSWDQVPSACFAATLIPRAAWQGVGPLDEGLPMYYEDSEWCYRARLQGWQVRLAAGAWVYHAFSGSAADAPVDSLNALKLRRVIYGRLRFATRLLGPGWLARFLLTYAGEDGLRLGADILRGRWARAAAPLTGWRDFLTSLPALRLERRALQARRLISDGVLLGLQAKIPPALVWKGRPVLTWDVVCNIYAPLLASRSTRSLPEYADTTPIRLHPAQWWRRIPGIWSREGPASLLARLGKQLRAWIAKP